MNVCFDYVLFDLMHDRKVVSRYTQHFALTSLIFRCWQSIC